MSKHNLRSTKMSDEESADDLHTMFSTPASKNIEIDEGTGSNSNPIAEIAPLLSALRADTSEILIGIQSDIKQANFGNSKQSKRNKNASCSVG